MVVVVALVLATGVTLADPAEAQTWAPASTARIHPGVRVASASGQCTSNFVFTNGSDVLLGQAAHCTATSGPTSTNGCRQAQPPLPLGSPIEIDGAQRPGTLAYSSWNAMIAAGEQDAATCAYNDFALVRIDPADVPRVNPSVPAWGGPRGFGKSQTGKAVHTFGNSDLRLGIRKLSPKTGATVFTDQTGWRYDVATVTPGVFGDSGSPILNSSGRALGIVVTITAVPPGLNGVTSLEHAMAYARAHGMPGLTLVDGTKKFNPRPIVRISRAMLLG